MMKTTPFKLIVIGLTLGSVSSIAHAIPSAHDGITFPDGDISFADSLLLYDNTYGGFGSGTPTDERFLDGTDALGPPDYTGTLNITGEGAVSLGRGGIIQLGFTDNTLTNSGNNSDDLHIFEIGADIENTFVAIRPTSDTLSLLNGIYAPGTFNNGFLDIGFVGGSTSSLDIDSIFSGFAAGQLRFDAVQLIDDPDEGQTATGPTVGADIDAVGAIFSAAPVHRVPEPGSLGLLASGLLLTLFRRFK